MKIHTKTALILFTTLLLGVLPGALAGGPLLFRSHLPPHSRMGFSQHFVEHFSEIIDPNKSQQDTVNTIVEAYSERFADMNARHHEEMEVLMDSMHTELSPLLSEEQIESMKEHTARPPFLMEGPPRHHRVRHE